LHRRRSWRTADTASSRRRASTGRSIQSRRAECGAAPHRDSERSWSRRRPGWAALGARVRTSSRCRARRSASPAACRGTS